MQNNLSLHIFQKTQFRQKWVWQYCTNPAKWILHSGGTIGRVDGKRGRASGVCRRRLPPWQKDYYTLVAPWGVWMAREGELVVCAEGVCPPPLAKKTTTHWWHHGEGWVAREGELVVCAEGLTPPLILFVTRGKGVIQKYWEDIKEDG